MVLFCGNAFQYLHKFALGPFTLGFFHIRALLTSILVDKFISSPFILTAARYAVTWIGCVLFLFSPCCIFRLFSIFHCNKQRYSKHPGPGSQPAHVAVFLWGMSQAVESLCCTVSALSIFLGIANHSPKSP